MPVSFPSAEASRPSAGASRRATGASRPPAEAARPTAGARPALVVVAHGSRDPRHAATVHALVAQVRSMRPGLRVATGFLEFNLPQVSGVLGALAAQGVRQIVAQPLLLSRAFHAKADIPAVLRKAPGGLGVSPVGDWGGIRQAEVLGPDPLLITALERRLTEAGLAPGDRASTGIVLAAAGSTDPEAIAVIDDMAHRWQRSGWCAVRPAFASATAPLTHVPGTAEAVRRLRADGARRVAVAPYVLAPGRLPDRIARGAVAAGADLLAAVLGPSPEVARVLLERYDEACGRAVRALGA